MKEITLTQGKVAIVDDEDFEWLNQTKWCFHHGYAVGIVNKKKVFMHRAVMNTPDGMITDHRDRNPLNNQKSNLRICTEAQNHRNASKTKNKKHSQYKGVTILRYKGKEHSYRAYIEMDGKVTTKSFPFTPEGEIAAARHYNELALSMFGEFAALNQV